MRRVAATSLVFALAVLPRAARADRAGDDPPAIDLITMGAGDDLFSHFGHSAICVTDARSPGGRCYNYGTADFSTPVPLTWEFIRGRAMFWVSVVPFDRMVRWYVAEDRTVWRQRLPLTPAEARALADALEASTAEAVKFYRYHHFEDNCTTRIRDLVDQAVGGRVRRYSGDRRDGPSFREYARQGFAGHAPLLVAANVVLGRAADRPTTAWEGMFLPERFRDAVEGALGAKPVVVFARRAPLLPGSTSAGELLLAGLGLGLAALVLTTRWVGPRAERVGLALTGVVLGVFGAGLWALAILSAFSELRINEVLLVVVPLDLGLAVLSNARLETYLRARLGLLALVALAGVTGLFTQPLLPTLALTGLPVIAASISRRGARL